MEVNMGLQLQQYLLDRWYLEFLLKCNHQFDVLAELCWSKDDGTVLKNVHFSFMNFILL